MEKNVCFLCDGEFVFESWYGKCDRCGILRPESKKRLLEEMHNMIAFRTEIGKHLRDLEQNKISCPSEMTKNEKDEYDIWTKHNALYNELMVFMDQYDIKEVRFRQIYPRLYLYVRVVDKIKQMYH